MLRERIASIKTVTFRNIDNTMLMFNLCVLFLYLPLKNIRIKLCSQISCCKILVLGWLNQPLFVSPPRRDAD